MALKAFTPPQQHYKKITNQIVKGFNQKQPPERTIVVSLDLSKAFDTVNIHNLIQKIQQTNIPNLIKKFVAKLY